MKKKSKRIVAVGIILLILLFVSACAAVAFTNNDSNIEPFKLPELSISGNDGFNAQSKATASISAKSGLTFVDGQNQQRVEFKNPVDNPCEFVVSLYLGDGTHLFTTNPIKPGEIVNSVNLLHDLKPGTYKDAILVYDCYSYNGEPLTRCEFIIEITNK